MSMINKMIKKQLVKPMIKMAVAAYENGRDDYLDGDFDAEEYEILVKKKIEEELGF